MDGLEIIEQIAIQSEGELDCDARYEQGHALFRFQIDVIELLDRHKMQHPGKESILSGFAEAPVLGIILAKEGVIITGFGLVHPFAPFFPRPTLKLHAQADNRRACQQEEEDVHTVSHALKVPNFSTLGKAFPNPLIPA